MMTRAVVILIVLSDPAWAEQFSIRCARDGWYFMTFDTDAKRAVSESPGGSAQKGPIDSITAEAIHFKLLRGGQSPVSLVWMRGPNQVTGRSDESKVSETLDCTKWELRPILHLYDRIGPLE
jgi:hypothetical protein